MCSGAVGCLLLGCQTDESVNQPGLQSCQMLQTPSDLLAPWEQETVVGALCFGSLIQESSTIAAGVEPVLLITQHPNSSGIFSVLNHCISFCLCIILN